MRYYSNLSHLLLLVVTISFGCKLCFVESRLYNNDVMFLKNRKSCLPSSSSVTRLLLMSQRRPVSRSVNKPNLAFVHQNHNRLTLPVVPSRTAMSAVTDPNLSWTWWWSLRVTSAVATYVGLVAWLDRPRGQLLLPSSSSILDDTSIDNEMPCLQVAPSRVPGAGLGLFTTRSLPRNTMLGTYPGVLVPIPLHMAKLRAFPHCEAYTWRFSDNEYVLDPTDAQGYLGDTCIGGNPSTPMSVWLFEKFLSTIKLPPPVPTTLCRINEPPKGCDVNVVTREFLHNRTVSFTLERDVAAGEELFMDYGLYYDRSTYGRAANNLINTNTTSNVDVLQ